MRQYYINEGYFFAISHGGRAYMPLSESAFLQSYGVAPIGQPVGIGFVGLSLFWCKEILYYTATVFFPICLFFIVHNYIDYEIHETEGVRKTLQESYRGFSPYTFVFLHVLPHAWAIIYFNMRRYKYFFVEKEDETRWGNDVLAYDSHN